MVRLSPWVVVLLLAACGGGSPASAVVTDNDGDGSSADVDCNDNNASVHPGATEVPYDGVDQDCDGSDLTDVDKDGYDGGPKGTDCDDQNAAAHPGATEVCGDDIDQDCSGKDLSCDEVDQDNDGYTPKRGDCDDHDAAIHPGATEVAYNGKDDDCNSASPDDDLDGDGSNHDVDCDDNDPKVHPGAEETPYDGIDQDCNGKDLVDVDADGDPPVIAGGGDCNDNDPTVSSLNAEIPYDGKDNDCNPRTTDDDIDGDGYRHNVDCDDTDRTVHPGAHETAYDGIDQNCDGKDLTDVDGDGHDGVESVGTNGDDCDDRDAKVNPSVTEVPYNGKDDDCNPTTPDDDLDGDGFIKAMECDDANADRFPGHAEVPYDGLDQDCDGKDLTDVDLDGQDSIKVAGGTDCNDDDATIYKGAPEIFTDEIDQDCDGLAAKDNDGDGWASIATGGTDCNDDEASINPGVTETCGNDVDEDCSGHANGCIYWKKGPQNDVSPDDLIGWTQCYTNGYEDNSPDTVPPPDCTGKEILIACKNINEDKIRVLAMANYDDVFFDTGELDPANGGTTTHNANGSEWYYHLYDIKDAQNHSGWGFANDGDKVRILYCDNYDDFNGLVHQNNRICFGLTANGFRGGYRCGDQLNLRKAADGGTGGADWVRLVYTSDVIP